MIEPFQLSLLREKFILRDPADDLNDEPPIVALSNRIHLNLINETGSERDSYVIRTQNMHSCVRTAAAIQKEFMERGSLAARITEFRWDNLWNDVIKGHDKKWNPDVWCTIYHHGQAVFESGAHHPFLDIIEKCDAKQKSDYAESVFFAEEAFKQAGKNVKIEHDSNIALILKVEEEEAKCGLIMRGSSRTTTFNFTVKEHFRHKEAIKPATIMSVSAAFLEGLQLSFFVGLNNKRVELELIEKYSDEYRRWERASKRMGSLNTAISQFELKYEVNYRPERPSFGDMVTEAEKFGAKILKSELKEKILTENKNGEEDEITL